MYKHKSSLAYADLNSAASSLIIYIEYLKLGLYMRVFNLLIILCLSVSAYSQDFNLRGRIVDERKEGVPFANIALYHLNDTVNIVKGNASDLLGDYSFQSVESGSYLLKISYIGYKTKSIPVTINRNVVQNVILEIDTRLITEVVVEGKRGIRSIDKTSYTFSNAQIEKAENGRGLIATLPNLLIDKTTNSLSTINGKSILILINGIKATDDDLKLIPANKIKNVEIYDVPPMRYINDVENVVNVRTKPLDTGWSGNLYGTLGQMFSNTSVALSYVKGDNKLTFNYGTHINMKRDIKDLEAGHYNYGISGSRYVYDYVRESLFWGHQHNVELTYSISKEKSYDFQIKALANISNEKLDANKNILFTQNEFQEERTGILNDYKKTVVPTLDIYYSKIFTKNNSISFNMVGSFFDNEQKTHSMENGLTGFDDRMSINNQKKTLIGELVYQHGFSKVNLSIGYRGHFNYLTNKLKNSMYVEWQKQNISTQKHYAYGELGGKLKSFMYRISLGVNYDVQSEGNGFHNLTFTPLLMAGYNINDANSIRVTYNSSTQMPDMLQMSDARILIMNRFYQTGNTNLVNSHLQSLGVGYDLYLKRFSLSANLFYDYTGNSLFDSYQYGDDGIMFQTGNAEKDIRRGGEINLNYTPWDFLRFGGSIRVSQQVFQPSKEVSSFSYWSYPVSVYMSAQYKNFSFDIFQKFGGTFLSGLYKTGIEKVSYISLGYNYKKINFGLQCFFPFIKDKYSNEIIQNSIVYHKTDYHLKHKDHAFALSVSWFFGIGKKKSSVQQNMKNYDNDNGLFKIK